MFKAAVLLTASLWLGSVNAHLAAWAKGMYCIDGPIGSQDLNSYSIVHPLYQLSKSDWWFHHVDGCDQYPPPDGDYVDLPAGGSFQVEIASNRAKTTLSYNGRDASAWPDGATYPEDYNVPSCIISPNMHTQNQSMAAGTAFAISYVSELSQVTAENLVVFTTRRNTPWKRVVIYDVPAAMPACPAGGCICAWGWVPNGCGQPNMYHQPFKCRVSGAKSTTPVAAAKPPVWCENNPGGCTKGAKQMIYWNQNDGNNVAVSGWDASGAPKSPGYNPKMGFADGAQNDIFAGPSSGPAPVPVPIPSVIKSVTAKGSSPSASSSAPAAATSTSAASTSVAAAAAAASTAIKNTAPSCQKRRRRRSTPLDVNTREEFSMAKRSFLADAMAKHRRTHQVSPAW